VTQNPDPEDLKTALNNFMLSCTGYTVAMYVLGIGDRHNDNIMIKKCGKLFHIDFGHVMGNFKSKFGFRRERSFRKVEKNNLKYFESTVKKVCFLSLLPVLSPILILAFLALREKGCLLISLLAMMLSTGMPELQSECDLEYMRTALQLNDDISEEEALAHFRFDIYCIAASKCNPNFLGEISTHH
jgi:phosphatidylinositol kinase/protein kinase (PI-3  family)